LIILLVLLLLLKAWPGLQCRVQCWDISGALLPGGVPPSCDDGCMTVVVMVTS
jgi:hypothetical protein